MKCVVKDCEEPPVEGGTQCIKHEGGFGLGTEYFIVWHLVELHPGCDRWMMGDKYGRVTSKKEGKVYVQLERSGKTLPFEPERLKHRRF